MIKTHKHLSLFVSLLSVLLVSTTAIFKKYFPFFLHHTVYYCEELMRSFSIQIPKSFGSIMLIFATIMGGLVGLKMIYTFIKIYLFHRELQGKQISYQTTYAVEKKLNLLEKVSIIGDAKPLAFCFGIRRPKIYLSTGLLKMTNEKELEAILYHEKYHLDHRDSLTHLIASITLSLFPFFPILTDLMSQYHIKREVNADSQVTKEMNSSVYLVSVLRKFLQYEPTPTFAFASALAKWDTLEFRIKSLIRQKVVYPKLSLTRISLSFVSGAAMYGLLLAPVNAVELHDKHEDVMIVCMQGNECANWCKKNATVVLPMTKAPNVSIPYTPISSSN